MKETCQYVRERLVEAQSLTVEKGVKVGHGDPGQLRATGSFPAGTQMSQV